MKHTYSAIVLATGLLAAVPQTFGGTYSDLGISGTQDGLDGLETFTRIWTDADGETYFLNNGAQVTSISGRNRRFIRSNIAKEGPVYLATRKLVGLLPSALRLALHEELLQQERARLGAELDLPSDQELTEDQLNLLVARVKKREAALSAVERSEYYQKIILKELESE